ncbi:hypothetical protein Glove_346g99 [Diversispora epigaea]|uniref:Uncharacterized protein n=1 Tax=Diversispora epigaea TaxID=1348612 RepID=A0A397HFL1_9GLOM|nr:hypothetical protein Glove_346g99 [Diversispora epigaea]
MTKDIAVSFNNRTPPLLWSHFRSSSTDLIDSWASGSCVPLKFNRIHLPSSNYYLSFISFTLHNNTTSDDDWNKLHGIRSKYDVTSDNGNYYLDEDDLEYNEFNEGFFNDPSSQLLNSFIVGFCDLSVRVKNMIFRCKKYKELLNGDLQWVCSHADWIWIGLVLVARILFTCFGLDY